MGIGRCLLSIRVFSLILDPNLKHHIGGAVCGDTALHIASRRGNVQLVTALLNRGADATTITNRKGETAEIVRLNNVT